MMEFESQGIKCISKAPPPKDVMKLPSKVGRSFAKFKNSRFAGVIYVSLVSLNQPYSLGGFQLNLM